MDRQGTATTQRESTPQAPEQGGDPKGEKPGGEKPGGKQPGQAKNGDPRGNKASNAPGENTPGNDPSAQATEVTGVQPSNQDRWGDLPEHAREIFRMQGGGDLPPRYREWIDAYYKRLNKRP